MDILACWEHHLIREYENLVQHPNNYILIVEMGDILSKYLNKCKFFLNSLFGANIYNYY